MAGRRVRAGAWAARGLRVPSRDALLADVVPAAYGRAYGFERAMDNLGAIIGPLLAIALVGLVGVRTAILLSIIPGLLAVAAILYAIGRIAQRERRPLRLRVRPVLRGRLGRLLAGVSVFELGNVAATLLILRATELLEPGRGRDAAAQQAIALYVLYNVAATVVSVPAGRHGDRRGALHVLAGGVGCFALAYAGFAATDASIPLLAVCFALAGVGIGCVETAEHAAVASLAPEQVRGSAFGVLAGVQSLGNLAASAIAGVLYTVVSPAAAFAYAAVLMGAALLVLAVNRVP